MNELDLREGLRALSEAVPPGPPERAASSVRRARRMRRNQAAVSLAVVAAVAAPAAYVVARPTTTTPPTTSQGVPPLHEWPQHRDPALRVAESRAIEADFQPVGYGLTRRVLYSGTVGEEVVVVYADCGPSACVRAVVANASREDASDEPGLDGNSRWSYLPRDVTSGVPDAPLATYLVDKTTGTRGPANVVFVLPPPTTTRVTWESPARRPGTGGSGVLTESGGGFSGYVGYLTALAQVTATDAHGTVTASGVVGDEDRTPPRVPELPPIEIPPGMNMQISSHGGQGSTRFEDGTGNLVGRVAVLVRCEGARPLVVTAPRVHKSVPCDGDLQRVDLPGVFDGEFATFEFAADRYTALSFAVVTVD